MKKLITLLVGSLLSSELLASEVLNNFSEYLYFIKHKNPAIIKLSPVITVGLDKESSATNFTYDLNGDDESESYTQDKTDLDLSMAFSTAEVGAQVYITKSNYSGYFHDKEYLEELESYDILSSIQMKLIDSVFIGFSMNWNLADGNVYGGDVGVNNDLGVRSRTTKMSTGLNYQGSNYVVGVFYGFLGKGKLQISGEEN